MSNQKRSAGPFPTINTLASADPSYARLVALAEHVTDPSRRGAVHSSLNRIDYLTEVIQTAETLRRAEVLAARKAGESWASIAAQIGITKQAAQQRFRVPFVDAQDQPLAP